MYCALLCAQSQHLNLFFLLFFYIKITDNVVITFDLATCVRYSDKRKSPYKVIPMNASSLICSALSHLPFMLNVSNTPTNTKIAVLKNEHQKECEINVYITRGVKQKIDELLTCQQEAHSPLSSALTALRRHHTAIGIQVGGLLSSFATSDTLTFFYRHTPNQRTLPLTAWLLHNNDGHPYISVALSQED